MGKTAINWTEMVWNPLRGCSRVSEGCRNCYAERQAARFKGPGQAYEGLVKSTPEGPKWTGKVVLVEERLQDPLRWRKPRRIFVNSMSDLFHEDVPDEWIDRIFGVMARCPEHVFQILTKRPSHLLEWMDGAKQRIVPHLRASWNHPEQQEDWINRWAKYDNNWPLRHVWLGVSCEDQHTADERIPLLLKTPAAVRWISAEPLLGSIDLEAFVWPQCIAATREEHDRECGGGMWCDERSLDWIVVGGESGPNARPMHPEWARSIRDQCQQAGVPYFFKQFGEWSPDGFGPNAAAINVDGWWERFPVSETDRLSQKGTITTYKVGKKLAGRQLDGQEWNQMPGESSDLL